MNEREAVAPDDLFRLSFLQAGTLAPDGSRVAIAVSLHDGAEDKDVSQLWLIDLETSTSRQLTHTGSNADPAWSPDGRFLAFSSDRSGKVQLHLLPLAGGEARQLTTLSHGMSGTPVWSPDGTRLAFSARPDDAAEPEPDVPYRVTRHVYRFDMLGYLDTAVLDLYSLELAEGAQPVRLTNDAAMNTNPRWSPDGQRILYGATMLPDTVRAVATQPRLVDMAGQVTQVVPAEWGLIQPGLTWLSDGRRFAFLGTPAGLALGSKADLFVAPVDGSTSPENRTSQLVTGCGGRLQADFPAAGIMSAPAVIALSEDGRTAFVQSQIGGTVQIFRVALDGPEAHASVLEGDRSCLLLELSDTGRDLLYAVSTVHDPLNLFIADIEGRNERQLTFLNQAHVGDRERSGIEHLRFTGSDGAVVEGWLLTPSAGAAAPYPTILYIHGGPHGAFGHIFHFDMQMLVGAGYAVLIVNQRASTGYGDTFATAIKGAWGKLDYGDLMAGVDEAIGRGLVDPERLGVCGLSGGGNLTCWIVGQTDRFKAAVPENPVTNWVSFYGVSDIGVWFAVEELGGHPHEIPDVYRRCSPITYAHRCTTPTLLIQGEQDWRCPAEQAEQFYTVLKANGCEVEMLRLPQSAHAGAIMGLPRVRRAQNEALLAWFERFV